jgi:tetratricopeptide (TPR) repeat protein
MNRFEEAIRFYDKAIEVDPEYAKCWVMKGVCLRKLGRLEEALSCHEKATSCSPPDVLGWYNNGSIQEELGRTQEAIDSYKRYLSTAPSDKALAKWVEERLKTLKSRPA